MPCSKDTDMRMRRKILLIRTFQNVGLGGPLPPLELLYLASAIQRSFGSSYEIDIMDTGPDNLQAGEIREKIRDFSPHIVILQSLIWEAGWAHTIAAIVKGLNSRVVIIAQGQLPSLVKEYLLYDRNIDYAILGEAEVTLVELLGCLEGNSDLAVVNGIAYRKGTTPQATPPRRYCKDLDQLTISETVWDLIDIWRYSECRGWSGSLKERFYIPILTSRGCPFSCTYCYYREVMGSEFRGRSPESVLAEINFLRDRYQVKELHIFDAVFNFDTERAKKICRLIIDSSSPLSLAFPYGLRIDLMDEELIRLLRASGTYKIVYGIETAVPRLQSLIGKDLGIVEIRDVISKTAQSGIIVGGYFMLGFPTETYDEMRQTVRFAVDSDLDVASFFKVTRFDDIISHYRSQFSLDQKQSETAFDFQDYSYYSAKQSDAEVSVQELNSVLLEAQQEFYLQRNRFWRGLRKSPHKISYLKNFMSACGLLLQSYLLRRALR